MCHVAEQSQGDLATCVISYPHRTRALIRATLSRGNHVYASATSTAEKRVRLAFRTRHRLAHGRYTLTLRPANGSSQVMTIRI